MNDQYQRDFQRALMASIQTHQEQGGAALPEDDDMPPPPPYSELDPHRQPAQPQAGPSRLPQQAAVPLPRKRQRTEPGVGVGARVELGAGRRKIESLDLTGDSDDEVTGRRDEKRAFGGAGQAVPMNTPGLYRPVPETGVVPLVRPMEIKYLKGAIRITATPGRIASGAINTVKPDEVFVKESLLSAYLHFFYFDESYFSTFLPIRGQGSHSLRKVKVCIGKAIGMEDPTLIEEAEIRVNDQRAREGKPPLIPASKRNKPSTSKGYTKAEHEAVSGELRKLWHELLGDSFEAIYPKCGGCAHSKVAALIYEGMDGKPFLRVLVTSANACPSDFAKADNHFYIQDFPSLPSHKRGKGVTGFEADLLSHFSDLGAPSDFLDSVRGNFDFSLCKVHLVTSVPRTTRKVTVEDQVKKHSRNYALNRLAALSKASIPKDRRKDVRLEVCTGSVGRLHQGKEKWLMWVYDELCGSSKTRSRKNLKKEEGDLPPVTIVFPSRGNVQQCSEEAQASAVNMGSHNHWERSSDGLKRLFYEFYSRDFGQMMHQKFYAAFSLSEPNQKPYWIMIGSSNLSGGAQGVLTKAGNLAAVNFECNIFVEGRDIAELVEGGDWREVFTYQRPLVPYRRDARPYTSTAFGVRAEEEARMEELLEQMCEGGE